MANLPPIAAREVMIACAQGEVLPADDSNVTAHVRSEHARSRSGTEVFECRSPGGVRSSGAWDSVAAHCR